MPSPQFRRCLTGIPIGSSGHDHPKLEPVEQQGHFAKKVIRNNRVALQSNCGEKPSESTTLTLYLVDHDYQIAFVDEPCPPFISAFFSLELHGQRDLRVQTASSDSSAT